MSEITISLAFLNAKDTSDAGVTLQWLRNTLKEAGYADTDYSIEAETLKSRRIGVARLTNRVRAFYHPLESSPYITLNLRDQKSTRLTCISDDYESIKEGIRFDDDPVEVVTFATTAIQHCRLTLSDASLNAPYRLCSRSQLIERYFDKIGLLKTQYNALNEDLAFISYLIDRGLFPVIGDESGHLQIDSDSQSH